MAHDRSTTDAILTEHFKYTPLSVIDDIINSINSIIYKALTALESGLLQQAPKNLGFSDTKASSKTQPPTVAKSAAELARAEIENGTHALETLLEAAVDKNFDIFELFALQHIFAIEPEIVEFVRLAHYEGVQWPLGQVGDEKDAAPTPERIARLREDLKAERQVGLAFEKEIAAMDSVLGQLRALTGPSGALGILGAGAEGNATKTGAKTATPLTTTAQFSTSQLPGLKILLRELKSKMAALPANAAELRSRDRPGSTGDEERKRYVETVAKRAVRDNLGSTERGESELGPARGIGEVQALEGLLGSGGRDADDDDEGVD